MQAQWIDISVTLRSGMVHWPSDPAVSIKQTRDMDRGDQLNLTKLDMGAHTGTHMDAPRHFVQGKPAIDAMPLEVAIGSARVIEIKDPVSVRVEELHPHDIHEGERILFKTKNSGNCWAEKGFSENFVYISKEAALYLVERRIQLVGIDYLSVGGYQVDGAEIHRILLGKEIWIIEGLDLNKAQPGRYDLICLPLKIGGGDGAPARAVIKWQS